MTKDEAISKVVSLAYDQVGYKEGNNNYNKYAADPRMKQLYGWDVQNQPWCAVFVNWLFINAFGYDDGVAMTYGGSAACSVAAQNYKNNNAWSTNARKGDQIFFNISGGINHTGIVVDVSGSTIRTIEGNSSDRVSQCSYYSGDPTIAGYGVPRWSVAADLPDDEPNQDPEPVNSKTGLVVDGECGPATWTAIKNKMPNFDKLPILKKGSKGSNVRFLQAILNYFGASLVLDGDFGELTEKEVIEFQEGKL